jgi:AsmA protein
LQAGPPGPKVWQKQEKKEQKMRWIIRFGAGLVVVLILAFGMLALVPAERVAAALSAQFEAMTGRKLTLTGEVTPRLWPSLGVTTGPVSIANADWAETEAPLFKAESLRIDINYGALMGGAVQIEGVSADQPEIVLERGPDGRGSWEFGASGTEGVPAASPAFTLDKGMITGGSIRFIDRQSDRVIALDGVDATLAIPDQAGPFTLAVTGLADGKPVALDLTGGVFSAFEAGRVVPLTLALKAGGSSLSFDGRGGLSPLVAEGALEADLGDLPALGALIGTALSAPGPGLGADRLTATGQLTLDGTGAAFLRDATIVADGNQVTGDIDLRPGEARPKLVGALTAGPVTIGSGPEGESAAQSGGWSEAVIDVSALGGFDAELVLVAPSVSYGQLILGETRVTVTIDRARAVTQIRQMAAYGGQITGEFVVNGRGGLSVGGNLAFAGLDMQALLKDAAGYDRLVAAGDLELRFLGVGNSVSAIMQSLEGEGALELGQGEVRGIDVTAMLQTLDPGYIGDGQKTAFDGLAGTFTIAKGVLSNSDLKLVAPQLTAAGAGTVGLGTRTLDYRLRPTALAASDGSGGVMVPLLITGPWADPRFRLDLEGIAREKMEAEAKAAATAAEAAAKAELEQRLQDELGVTVAPDESLGDAAVRGAEEALQDETRKILEDILGGN